MSPRREYAVLVPRFVPAGGEECVILTERAAELPRFAGHVSFPGGAREAEDASLRETALREAREEIGLPGEQVEIVAELEWFSTTIGHEVKPFVARVTGPFTPQPDPGEVARVLFVPVALLRDDPFERRPGHGSLTVYTFPFEGVEIWGLTARILRRLFVDPT